MKTPKMLAVAGRFAFANPSDAMASAPRAVFAAPRAEPDLNDPKAIFAALNATLTEMRGKIDAQGTKVDAMDTAQIDKINTRVGELQAALDQANTAIAAAQLGGNPGGSLSAEDKKHVDAFMAFARKGIDSPEARGATFSDPDGGFLAPKQVDMGITRILGKTVAMRRLAATMGISSDTYVKHKGLGGASSGWVGEGDTRSETNTPTLSRLEFVTGELYAEPAATQKLLDDAQADVEGWYAGEVAIEFAEQEGAAFISGDGVKKPRGFLAYPIVEQTGSSVAWGKIGFKRSGKAADFADPSATTAPADALIDLIHSLRSGYRQSASFLMNDLTLAKVRKFKNVAGDYLWQPSLTADAPSLLLGKPVDTDDNMPDVAANAFPIAFGDFKQGYLIVDRFGIRVLRNPYKVNGVVFFYSTKRVGGGVQNFEAIKLLKVTA